MTYRAIPISQRDGSAYANANCGMASCATGIDYHTEGFVTSTGAEMRRRQSDQEGGTDWYDAAEAWQTYGQTLSVRNGYEWSDALADLNAGRAILLSVWHSSTGGPCMSGSGAYGHGMCVAPEKNGSKWLTNDPWCSPGKWVWWEESKLRQGAEEFGAQVYGRDVSGPEARKVPRHVLRTIVKILMNQAQPGE